MKKMVYATLVFAGIFSATVLITGCGVIGGPPKNLQLSAATDSTVQLVWTTPAEGMPDSFLVYFAPAGETLFAVIAETTGNGYIHNPGGRTGRYQVSAMFAGKEYRGSEVVSTIPVHTPAKTVAELDGIGDAGYGWDRDSGAGRTYSMRSRANAAKIDFYITDFTTGSVLPYKVASPNMGPSDPSGVVPADSLWRKTGFTNPLGDEQLPLPRIDPTQYFNYTSIPESIPALIGCYTVSDRHYALLKVNRVNPANSTVELETWFQLVPELTLIYHPAQ